MKIPSNEYDPLSMKTSDGTLGEEKFEQLDSQREKLLFTKGHTKKVACNSEDIEACTKITDLLDKAPCNMQTPNLHTCHQAHFRSYNNSKAPSTGRVK